MSQIQLKSVKNCFNLSLQFSGWTRRQHWWQVGESERERKNLLMADIILAVGVGVSFYVGNSFVGEQNN